MQCMPLRRPISPIRLSKAAMSSTASAPMFWLDGFAKRQWDPSYKGTKLLGKIDQQVRVEAVSGQRPSSPRQAFVDHVHTLYHEHKLSLVDGYAPFCKYAHAAFRCRHPAHHTAGTSSYQTFATWRSGKCASPTTTGTTS